MPDPNRALWRIPLKAEWPEGHIRIVLKTSGATVMDIPYTNTHKGFDMALKLARRQVKNHNGPITKRAAAGGIERQRRKQHDKNQDQYAASLESGGGLCVA